MGPLLDEALQRSPEDPRLLLLAARRHVLRGQDDAAETSFLRAIERSGESDRGRFRLGLAAFYSQQDRYSDAADQYGQVVNGDVLHPGAIELLRSLRNGKRLREALAWARTIREQHPHPPKSALDTEVQILNYVGDVHVAAERWAASCSRDDATPQDRLKLAQSLLWCGERNKAVAAVRDIDASEFRSEPRDLLGLAQLKHLLGESEYLEDAYAARRYGIADASVHHGYFGLFMSKEEDLARIHRSKLEGAGCRLAESSAGVPASAGRCRSEQARLGGAEGSGARVREACAGVLARGSDPGRRCERASGRER